VYEQTDDRAGIADSLRHLGEISLRRRDAARALRYLASARRFYLDVGSSAAQDVERQIGEIRQTEGEPDVTTGHREVLGEPA
jgi:hypothetical protein